MPKRPRASSSSEEGFAHGQAALEESSLHPSHAQHTSKYVHTTDENSRTTMKCSLPPHAEILSFSSLGDFEVHYQQAHAYRCAECRQNFPSDHFLSLHIAENHDPLNAARKARGEKIVRRAFCNNDSMAHDAGSFNALWKIVIKFALHQRREDYTSLRTDTCFRRQVHNYNEI